MKPAAAVWSVFILFLIYARKKGLFFTRQEKRRFVVISIIIVAVLASFFFKETGFVFICQKSTQRCYCFHSTLYDPKLRPTRSYDLSDITGTEIVPHKRSCGRYCRKTVYRVRFRGNNGDFEMPKDIDFKEDARIQAAKISAFIQTDKTDYVYKDTIPDGADKELMIVLTALTSTIFAFVGIFSILAKLFGKK